MLMQGITTVEGEGSGHGGITPVVGVGGVMVLQGAWAHDI